MSIRKGVHVCLERVSCLSGKGLKHVCKGVHICLLRGSCLSEKGF